MQAEQKLHLDIHHGYKIQRIDLPAQPIIDAIAENVIETTRGTVLGAGDAKCSTIEHAMSALYVFNIDNVLIQVNGPEFPILDGSAAPYVEKIKEIGTLEQEAERNWLEISHIVECKDEKTGSYIKLTPAEDYSISVTIDFNSDILPEQTATLCSLGDFEKELEASLRPINEGDIVEGIITIVDEDAAWSKPSTFPPRLIIAEVKESLVLVEGSKKRVPRILPRREILRVWNMWSPTHPVCTILS